jgi:hypothetical protein
MMSRHSEGMQEGMTFCFGSNISGRHGKGAALTARNKYGAVYGVGYGKQGDSFAIPTKDENLRVLSLALIKQYVDKFIIYALKHPEEIFYCTRIGCGLSGYKDHQIGPMFIGAPDNCILPDGWGKEIV